jgi:ABC-type bacteriocin/lantibiotic exporter with double-glycine peptidase domain
MQEKKYQSIFKLLIRLWAQISPSYRLKLYALFMLMVLSSVSEVFAIGAILPFLGVLVAPDKVFQSDMLAPLIKIFQIASSEELLLPITILFCLAVLFSGLIRILLLWLQFRVAFGLGADISASMFKRTLYQPYSSHISRNSSEVISGITTKSVGIIFSGIYPAIIILSSFLTLIAVFGSLLFIHAPSAIACVLGFGVIYFFVGGLSKSRLKKDGEIVNTQTNKVVQLIQEGLGGIRDVLIDGTQEVYVVNYKSAEDALKRSMANIQILSLFPRYVIESLGIVLVATVAYFLTSDDQGLSNTIPILGALAIGAQRLLPLIQQAYSNWSAVLSGRASVQEAMDLLGQPLPHRLNSDTALCKPFKTSVQLKDISYRYASNPVYILKNIDLLIPKGSKIGFIGSTGCGKSTLLDIIMGLLSPSSGNLMVDGLVIDATNAADWQKNIAHVPQAIFLSDATVYENIAFGVPFQQIDRDRVIRAAQKAQIAKSIEAFPGGYDSRVGERGIMLSGGQRQRIGIARAIYKGAAILVLDEATSALDVETEKNVIEQISNSSDDITMLIVAHRLTTLKHCSMLVELEDGKIKKIGTYDEIVINRLPAVG